MSAAAMRCKRRFGRANKATNVTLEVSCRHLTWSVQTEDPAARIARAQELSVLESTIPSLESLASIQPPQLADSRLDTIRGRSQGVQESLRVFRQIKSNTGFVMPRCNSDW